MMPLRERAKKLKSDIPAVYLALRDPQTPVAAKLLAGITIAYALSPIDLIPDFIPVLGYLDDILILPALAAVTIKLIPKTVWIRCRENAADLWKEGKPKKWVYAIPIAALWLLILLWIIKAIFH